MILSTLSAFSLKCKRIRMSFDVFPYPCAPLGTSLCSRARFVLDWEQREGFSLGYVIHTYWRAFKGFESAQGYSMNLEICEIMTTGSLSHRFHLGGSDTSACFFVWGEGNL